MYRVHYYNTSGNIRVKDLESLEDAWKFVEKLPKLIILPLPLPIEIEVEVFFAE